MAAFEADVEAAMQTFQMPGAAVALVQDNHIVYARGFGVRDLQTNAPVSPHTRFRIASNTKSMTSLLAATFVDQGLLDWDAPILGVWPEFLAPTPALTQACGCATCSGWALAWPSRQRSNSSCRPAPNRRWISCARSPTCR
jgi:CubicO group peptidase (beta-lactamase class C family)